ncbi:MAG: bifunctional 23S rRNA (guanine(2069)-N(7))-methyltransferase RlmK/23S rRNA (guanine(2445)-N(2))-methyltransferase RlmL [bacterium]|nr:bifunctional 23S rRNA (guanine(2069)-N(7))-methyltransferase RlmK/23S rRNA (guanine(2445)-N(2))-methyltransferase RlmL [Gammaproteobacteria bacterium]HIL98011.1 bifunctional 23S rRNA (guanine(2069)-N(7))-methyltransferase RlmK/23S rRNA (guanine(2445)-N(2))-methyltransferase RlmL [Pseudomonadales bacterium]
MTSLKFFATAAKGIETLLAEELDQLGMIDVKETRAGVFFSGDIEQAYRACLWSRLANRVLLPIARFECPSDDALYEQVKNIDWSGHMAVNQTLAVDASVSNASAGGLNHSQYAALKTKDAIVDFFRDRTGARPSVETEKPDLQINVYINNDEAQVSIDLSGKSLHERGYRNRGSAAPLKENLAAAILFRAKWQETCQQGGGFVDFMCGSGTLPIEAAMIACDIAPGLNRDYFGLLGWGQHDESVWQGLRREAVVRCEAGIEKAPLILGFDHHRGTLEKARQHARQAGLASVVTFEYQDVFSFQPGIPEAIFEKTGLVVINPPYGRRLGQDDDLEALYGAIGQVLKENFKGWKASVFTDDQSKGKAIGLRANKIHSLYNGALPCKLLHFNVDETSVLQNYRLPRLLAADELSEQSFGFRNRLGKNLKQFKRWSNRENISCYRVYDADLPDYAVAIDVYQGEGQSQKVWVNIQEYDAPKTIDPKKAKLRLREVVTIVKDVMQLQESEMYLKHRRRQRGESQYEKLANRDNFHVVREGACEFRVNFEDHLDTGLFLDHRPLRLKIAAQSQGKSFLNLFGYTGSFSVHAAKGGARRTLTIDMSNTYLDWARSNMALNGLSAESHRFLQADCLTWLENPRVNKTYDIIFLDPPSFSNSKRMKDVFEVQKDHGKIIDQAMKHLASDGVLYFSNNLRGFKLRGSELDKFQVEDITDETVPFDFKQRKHVHQCWEIRHLA